MLNENLKNEEVTEDDFKGFVDKYVAYSNKQNQELNEDLEKDKVTKNIGVCLNYDENEAVKDILKSVDSFNDVVLPKGDNKSEDLNFETIPGSEEYNSYDDKIPPNPTSIKTVLINIKVGERLDFDVNEETGENIRLLAIKIKAYNDLFSNHMNTKSDTSNNIALNNFLDKFTEIYTEMENLQVKACKEILGEEGYNYFVSNSGLTIKFNFALKRAEITRINKCKNNTYSIKAVDCLAEE